jgi:hypothetical protein
MESQLRLIGHSLCQVSWSIIESNRRFAAIRTRFDVDKRRSMGDIVSLCPQKLHLFKGGIGALY